MVHYELNKKEEVNKTFHNDKNDINEIQQMMNAVQIEKNKRTFKFDDLKS